MQRISIPNYEELSVEAKKEWDKQVASHGRITNMKKTLLHSLPSFRILMEWYDLRAEVLKFVGEMQFNLFAYAISSTNDCIICSTFFRKILKDNGINPDAKTLDEESALLIEYGKACVKNPSEVPESVFKRLKAKYTEEQIVLLTAFAGQMIATNLINNALEVPLDEYLVAYTKR